MYVVSIGRLSNLTSMNSALVSNDWYRLMTQKEKDRSLQQIKKVRRSHHYDKESPNQHQSNVPFLVKRDTSSLKMITVARFCFEFCLELCIFTLQFFVPFHIRFKSIKLHPFLKHQTNKASLLIHISITKKIGLHNNLYPLLPWTPPSKEHRETEHVWFFLFPSYS